MKPYRLTFLLLLAGALCASPVAAQEEEVLTEAEATVITTETTTEAVSDVAVEAEAPLVTEAIEVAAVDEAAQKVVVPADATEALALVKASNARLLAQQLELLKKLEELEKQADQLRIFAKRG